MVPEFLLHDLFSRGISTRMRLEHDNRLLSEINAIRFFIATNSRIFDESANKNEIIRALVTKIVNKQLP